MSQTSLIQGKTPDQIQMFRQHIEEKLVDDQRRVSAFKEVMNEICSPETSEPGRQYVQGCAEEWGKNHIQRLQASIAVNKWTLEQIAEEMTHSERNHENT